MSEPEQVKILVVDDDVDARSLISGVIEALGYTVNVCEDGNEALSYCNENGLPDIAVLDLMMPGINGLELCRKIKALPGGELVPVLMLTAIDELDEKINVLESGADEYLTKPFNFKELQTKVKVFLRIRALNLRLHRKSEELAAMQARLIAQEKQSTANQLGAGAAHSLGQPLTAIKLNLHLLEILERDDPKYKNAFSAIKGDVNRMAGMLEDLRSANAATTEKYHAGTSILSLGKGKAEKND